MTDVGRAEVEVRGDVRHFARQTERDLDAALSKIKLDPVDVPVDTDGIRKSGETAGRSLGKAVTKGADDEVRNSRGRISNSLKEAFTPHPGMFAALRAPFAAALSTPISAAVVTVAGTAALAFVGAFTAAIATAGLGAVFLGIGAAALFGAKKSRDEAQKDLDAAEERVRKAQQRAQSGTAAAKRSLAEARAELAKAQAAAADNAAFEKLDGSLKRLGGTLKEVGQRAAQPLMGPFTAALDSLSKAAERIEPLLTEIFSGLAPTVQPLTDGMAGFVEEFLKVLSADPKTLEGMRDALIAVGENLPRLGTLLGEIFALFASNENNVRNIGLLFGLLEMSLMNVASAVYGLSKVLDGLIIAWDGIKAGGSAAIDWITGTAWPAIVGVAKSIGDFFAGIPGAISSAWSAVTGFFSNLWNTVSTFVMSFITSVVGFFTELPGRILSAIMALPGMITSFFSNMISNLAYVVGFGIGTIVSFFVSLPGKVLAALRALPGLVVAGFTTMFNAVRSVVTAGISNTLSFFSQLPGRIRSAISSLASIVSSIFSSAASSAKSGASNVVSSAIGIIRGLPGQIRSALSTVRSSVTSAFSGAASWLVSAGRNILAGIKNGITSAIGGAVSAARNAARQIVNGFKDALKIGSPSRVAETEIGRWIPAGVAQGVERNMSVVDKAIRKIMPDALTPDIGFKIPPGRPRGGDGSELTGTMLHLTLQAGAIVIQGQGREAGLEAAEAVLERLGAATLAR